MVQVDGKKFSIKDWQQHKAQAKVEYETSDFHPFLIQEKFSKRQIEALKEYFIQTMYGLYTDSRTRSVNGWFIEQCNDALNELKTKRGAD